MSKFHGHSQKPAHLKAEEDTNQKTIVFSENKKYPNTFSLYIA